MFPSIVYSQCLRYQRIINNGVRLVRRLNDLKGYFLNSGYPSEMVEAVIDDVLKRKRNIENRDRTSDKPPFPVVWVQTYGPASDAIKSIVSDANRTAKLSAVWKDEPGPIIGVVHRRSKNLGDYILKRKQFALNTPSENLSTGTTRCTPVPPPGKKRPRGRSCESCTLMSNRKSVTSTATGRSYATPSGDCKSSKLIYLAECVICKLQYTGKTDNRLQKRISGHRSHVEDSEDDSSDADEEDDEEEDSDEKALAEHLSTAHGLDSVAGFNASYSFTILQQNPRNLARCEQKWMNQLVTLHPFGLNREKPCGVADSILNMSYQALNNPQRR